MRREEQETVDLGLLAALKEAITGVMTVMRPLEVSDDHVTSSKIGVSRASYYGTKEGKRGTTEHEDVKLGS
jgi:hypothetical protein